MSGVFKPLRAHPLADESCYFDIATTQVYLWGGVVAEWVGSKNVGHDDKNTNLMKHSILCH